MGRAAGPAGAMRRRARPKGRAEGRAADGRAVRTPQPLLRQDADGYADAVTAVQRPPRRSHALARRRAAAAIVGVAVLGLLTGCDLFAPQETKNIQEAADGVSGDIGAIFIGNAVLLTSDPAGQTNLVATLVNQGDSNEDVRISTDSGAVTVTVEPAESVQLGTPAGQAVAFQGLGAAPGSLAYVTFETSTQTETLDVPVLNGALPQYRDLAP